jgi:hypothetical protein
MNIWLRRFLAVFALFFVAQSVAKAQDLIGDFNADVFFDNREYMNFSETTPETIFGLRLAPTIGISLDSVHIFKIGVNPLFEFGSRKRVGDIAPIAYYQFHKKVLNEKLQIDFLFGMFARTPWLDENPRFLLNDTLQYYKPNIEGALLRLAYGKKSYFSVWTDWTLRQTDRDREKFLSGITGKQYVKDFFLGYALTLFHNAREGKPQPDDAYIQDDYGHYLNIGFEKKDWGKLKLFHISTGHALSAFKDRGTDEKFHISHGLLSNVAVHYWHVKLIGTHYWANNPAILRWGDKFYQATQYGRVDLQGLMNSQKWNVHFMLGFSLHFTKYGIDHTQYVKVGYHLNYLNKSLKKV